MEWIFDEANNAWNLFDNSSVVAKIFIKEKPDNKRKYLAKTLIASIYYGAKEFSRLSRKNKEWKIYNRKFHTREQLEQYLADKKNAVLKFIEKM